MVSQAPRLLTVMDFPDTGFLCCRVCGRAHHAVSVPFGHRALCVDCGSALPKRTRNGHAPLAFTATALILAVPALQLPLVTVGKFGAEHPSYLWTGARALWENGMPLLSVWVALCGILLPVILILALIGREALPRNNGTATLWARLCHALERWSMPEVHVLAVLVAFAKIGVLVRVDPGAGLWFYAGMAVAILAAWRTGEDWEAA